MPGHRQPCAALLPPSALPRQRAGTRTEDPRRAAARDLDQRTGRSLSPAPFVRSAGLAQPGAGRAVPLGA